MASEYYSEKNAHLSKGTGQLPMTNIPRIPRNVGLPYFWSP
jgi:hypothetical protein